MTDTLNLPELPETVEVAWTASGMTVLLDKDSLLFTAQQLRAYATAAVLAERERCARVASEYRNWNPFPTVYEAIASAIRGSSPPPKESE